VSAHLDVCGCVPPKSPAEPAIENRPGLDALAYRIGTHPAFLRRMLRSIPAIGTGTSLERLTTRDLDDPAIGLLDAFASVADVLAFYQERIANEGFLRTATERRSLLELARAIGYELGPGVAASAYLQFTVEDAAAGAPQPDPSQLPPNEATVPAGTRVKSLPGGGQLPQSFETTSELVARREWNRLRPLLARQAALDPAQKELYLQGLTTGLAVGDLMLLYSGSGDPVVKRVFLVEEQLERERTRVQFTAEALPPEERVEAAPIVRSEIVGEVTLDYEPFTAESVNSIVWGSEWNDQSLNVMLEIQAWPVFQMLQFFAGGPPSIPVLPAAKDGAYAFRQRAAGFGQAAPLHGALPANLRFGTWEATSSTDQNAREFHAGPYPNDWDAFPSPNVFQSSQGGWLPSPNDGSPESGIQAEDTVYLDAPYPKVVADSWAVLVVDGKWEQAEGFRVGSASDISQSDYGISAKVTQLQLQTVAGAVPAAEDRQKFPFRKTAVHVQSERLELAPIPLPDVLSVEEEEIELDTIVLGWTPGQPLAFTGERADMPGVYVTDVVELREATHSGGITRLAITELEHSFVRKTVTISANVVHATHGETVVSEVLGSADGSANQRFTLRRKPLTYVPSSSASGSDTTLEVRVNGVRWHEVHSLYGLGPTDRNYIVRRDDDGTTHVIFGDGIQGARPQSGMENVTATYRHGIGAPGLVPERKITLLETRPLGIREVVNPSPAEAAEDPENRDAARRNAPFTVITLDRVVSLTDYEDFARAFAGIGKATATALWEGERQIVHVTVAGVDGTIPPQERVKALATAVRDAQDPGRGFRVDVFKREYFQVVANVLVDPDRVPADVTAAAQRALADRFSFAAREFGQSVSEADVIETIMSVAGVLDTEVTGLAPIIGTTPPTNPPKETLLPSALADWSPAGGGTIEPAHLLLINPAGAIVTETERTVT
jgi:hypothetical protein